MADTIRLARPDDAGGCLEIYRPVVTETAASFELEPPTRGDMAGRIEETLPTFPWLVAVSAEGDVSGYAYAGAHRKRAAYRWCTEVSVYVAAARRRRGLARALYTRLFDCLRLQGYRNAYAGITLPNPPSVALHEAMGFTRVGVYPAIGFKFEKWHDVGWWALRLNNDTDSPAPPRALASCRNEVAALLASATD